LVVALRYLLLKVMSILTPHPASILARIAFRDALTALVASRPNADAINDTLKTELAVLGAHTLMRL
jgi:hypothetical protein